MNAWCTTTKMPRRCSVHGCRSNYDTEKELTSSFTLPKNENLRKVWLRNIPTDLSKLKNPIICIKHFEESCILRVIRVTTRKGEVLELPRKVPKLAANAVPTIFRDIVPVYYCKRLATKIKKHNCKMDTKNRITEEPELCSENVTEDLSEHFEKNIKTEIKEEPQSPDYCLEDMNELFPDENLNKVKSEIVPYEHLLNGTGHFPSIKIEIEEEQWWLDRNSTEAPSLSYEIKVEKDVDLISAELERVYEGASRSYNEELHKETNNQRSDVTEILSLSKMDNALLGLKQSKSFRANRSSNCGIPKKNKPVLAKDNKCDICEMRFTCPVHLKLHKLIHDGIRPLKCETCEKSFTRLSDLKKHNLIHEGKRPHQCNICDRRFTRLRDLNTHKWTHNGKKPYKCEICGKGFIRGSDLKIHKLYHEGKKPHKCETCEKRFTQLSELKTHKMVHEGKKSHVCNICGKGFIWHSNLRAHKLIHEIKKPHKCETCEKSFTRLSGVKHHKLVHESKAYKCDLCKKEFTLLSSLKRHRTIHEGTRPYKCDVCEQDFLHLVSLIKHKLIHNGKKPHKCGTCGKCFTLLSGLNRHSLIHKS